MDKSEELKNKIMLKMQHFLDSETMNILNNVLNDELTKVKISEPETSVATIDNTNEFIVQLFMMKKAPKLAKRTVDQYLIAVNSFLKHCPKSLMKVTTLDIEKWLTAISRTNCNASLNNNRRHLSAFFTWMRRSKIVSENPVESIEPYPEIEKPVDHLEPQEYEALKAGCVIKRDRAMIELLRSTAARVGEVEQLNINDIDWRTGAVTIYGEKTRRYRTAYLDEIALKYLGEYVQERGCPINDRIPLFVSRKKKNGQYLRLERAGIRAAIKAIANRSEVGRRIYPHLFRKTTATNICKRGGTIWEAGHYIGHRDRSTAGQRYVAEDEECVKSIFRLRVAAT